MNICLNGEKMDITLEAEKNLQDVMEGLEKWLLNEGMVVTTVTLNGEQMVSGEAWGKRPLGDIETLDLQAAPLSEVASDIVDTARQYLRLLARALDAGDQKLLAELKPGFPYMLETLEHLWKREARAALRDELQTLIAQLKETQPFSAGNTSPVPEICHRLLAMLEGRRPAPPINLAKFREELTASLAKMNEVSILLQTGKDKEAMAIVISLTDHLQQLQGLLARLKTEESFKLEEQQIDERSPETFYTELNGVLKELISAFDLKDYVLIGDLLEYEIVPKMEGIIRFISELEQNRGNNAGTI